jgi:hypothetical protein
MYLLNVLRKQKVKEAHARSLRTCSYNFQGDIFNDVKDIMSSFASRIHHAAERRGGTPIMERLTARGTEQRPPMCSIGCTTVFLLFRLSS